MNGDFDRWAIASYPFIPQGIQLPDPCQSAQSGHSQRVHIGSAPSHGVRVDCRASWLVVERGAHVPGAWREAFESSRVQRAIRTSDKNTQIWFPRKRIWAAVSRSRMYMGPWQRGHGQVVGWFKDDASVAGGGSWSRKRQSGSRFLRVRLANQPK